jgi:hypothetical protein
MLAKEEPRPDFLEQHFTIGELAKAWHMSRETLRLWFVDEPGVVKFGAGKLTKARRRTYVSLRVPKSVARRVYARHTGREL